MNKLREKLLSEPRAERGLPDCPRHLRGRARAAWNFWREALEVMGIDRRPDAQMLEGACVAYAKAVEADQLLLKDGLVVEDAIIDEETGERVVLKVRRHPADTISNAAWRQVRAFCSEFGLSPVSRNRVTVEKPKAPAQDLAAILNAPRESRVPTTVN